LNLKILKVGADPIANLNSILYRLLVIKFL
jgi:hypothetical protein